MIKFSIGEKEYMKRFCAKKAFTFAELMISLLVISILSAILYPTVAHFTPNSNKPLFKSAYKILNTVVAQIVTDSPTGTITTDTDGDDNDDNMTDGAGVANRVRLHSTFCIKFCERANVILRDTDGDGDFSDENCKTNCEVANNNWMQTTNGMRWRFYPFRSYTSPSPKNGSSDRTGGSAVQILDRNGGVRSTFKVFVDVNASNNELTQQEVGAIRNNYSDGVNNNVNIDQIFNAACTSVRKGRCGVFYFDQTNNANTGIYSSAHPLPNYAPGGGGAIVKEQFNSEHLKIQDTFEILINNDGKIEAMSPAAWANLEDHTAAGN